MRRSLWTSLTAVLVVGLWSCGGNGGGAPKPADSGAATPASPGEPGTAATPATPAAPESSTPAAAATATIKGKVTLEGAAPAMPDLSAMMVADPACAKAHEGKEPPKAEVVVTGPDGALVNAFVYVSAGVTQRFPAPKDPVKFDQHGCIYTPHVFGIQVGQPVEISNSDPTLHNIHSLSERNGSFNQGQAAGAPAIVKKFAKPEVPVTIKCDVHGWMKAYACVVEHPYFAVTGADGSFELPQKIAPGKYTLTVWHEKYPAVSQEITVAEDETKEVAFSVK